MGLKAIVGVVVAATVFAQVLPSCEEQGKVVLGWVDEKYEEPPHYVIVVDRKPYSVPYSFFVTVQVGDKVRYDPQRRAWQIVRRAGEPSEIVPITLLSPSPSPTPTR
ncbi:MAG: hypothetical protein N0A24_05310 [Armatimonadetes bacterium]|nr:hypothetical protein [Armatimonadota bacterium]MDW8153627.1 hypothetical protein [Armatimonadota bacterium]